MAVPEVDAIDGLPPAVALQQQRGSPTHALVGRQRHHAVEPAAHAVLARRRLSARAAACSYAEAFSPNTPAGRLPDVPRPRPRLRRHRALDGARRLADHPRARRSPPGRRPGTARTCATSWSRSATTSTRPWRELPKKDRDWILFTDEQPTVPVYAGFTPDETQRALKRKEEPSYMGTFTERAAVRAAHLRHHAERADEEARRAATWSAADCPACDGKRLRREALSVTFAGLDIAEIVAPAADSGWRALLRAVRADGTAARRTARRIPRQAIVRAAHRRATCVARIARAARPRASATCRWSAARRRCRPASCSGCASRRRCAPTCSAWSTCSTSRRPACIRPTPRRCSRALDRLKAAGQLAVRRRARARRDAPRRLDRRRRARRRASTAAQVLYSGPPDGPARASQASQTRALPVRRARRRRARTPRDAARLAARCAGVTRNNLRRRSTSRSRSAC